MALQSTILQTRPHRLRRASLIYLPHVRTRTKESVCQTGYKRNEISATLPVVEEVASRKIIDALEARVQTCTTVLTTIETREEHTVAGLIATGLMTDRTEAVAESLHIALDHETRVQTRTKDMAILDTMILMNRALTVRRGTA